MSLYTFPFAFLVMLAVFNRFDRSVEEAAWSLGVSPARTFRKVTFPLIFPGVLSAMLFSFTLSYDEFSRTLFTAGGQLTLPLAIYGTFSVEIHPNIFAFGVLTTLFSFSLLAVYAILMTMQRAARQAGRHPGGNPMSDLPAHVAIVTGAARGIGRAIADAPGAKPAPPWSSPISTLDAASEAVGRARSRRRAHDRDAGRRQRRGARSAPCSRRASAPSAPARSSSTMPASSTRRRSRRSTSADFDRMIAVHLRGTFLLHRAGRSARCSPPARA